MNNVGTAPNPPRVLPASAPAAIAPTPIDHAAGQAPRRDHHPGEPRGESAGGGGQAASEPAIKIAGALTALFAGEIVEALVEATPAGSTAALRLPEARLLAFEGATTDLPGTTVQVRLVRSGDEPSVELLDGNEKPRTPATVLKVRIEQTAAPTAPAQIVRLSAPPVPAPFQEPLLSASGIVSLPAMMGRVAVHVPANAAYLHTSSGLPETPIVAEAAAVAESQVVPPRLAAIWEEFWLAMEASPLAADRVRELLQPREPMRLAAGLLFLSTALRHGSLRQWLGDEAFNRLSAGRADGLRRAQASFEDLARQARDPGAEGWRSIPLALIDTTMVRPAMLYVHRPPRRRKTDPEPADGATRFMLDLALSATGPLRIDGLFRQKLLDLIIRTERAVPRVISGELRTLYAGALAAAGLTGKLDFQTVSRLPPAPASRITGPSAALTA